MAYRTNLSNADATFASMMENGFGIVTVMNAKVYEAPEASVFANSTPYNIISQLGDAICELDTLKIANVTQEGPTKTITGGKYSNALVKFGKSARLEMQDALGRAKAIEAICGGIREWGTGDAEKKTTGLHFGEDFQGPKTIVGESFFIDRVTGKQIDVYVIFYQFLPDSIFNLTQDAEGDASVFDMNGDLLTTEVLIGRETGDEQVHGVFYSVIEKSNTPNTPVKPTKATVTLVAVTDDQTAVDVPWPISWSNGIKEVESGTSVTLPNITNPSGYTFDAFYSDNACSNAVSSPVVVNADMTIYVKFNHN